MNRAGPLWKDGLLPLGVFVAAFALHFLWLGLFPEQDPAQSPWAALPSEGASSWLPKYLEAGEYWLGYAYGLSLAFAAAALRRYRRHRSCGAGKFAVGGVTLSAVLAGGGCYLIGCCGSPLLVVWLNLLGAKFLPLARPLMAGITTLSIAGAWWWMARGALTRLSTR
ncbi:MAG: hypothetical protein HY900_35865 [Deltaproteobacteria bacterium]|nr:hypothetical protein [Deltaproteobacteria bacterium]